MPQARGPRLGHTRISLAAGPLAAGDKGTRCAGWSKTRLCEGEQDEDRGRRLSPGEAAGVKAFAELYAALDATTKTNEKIEALANYFSRVPPEGRPPGPSTS